MGVQVSIRCDVCAKEKLQTNHWYMASKTNAATSAMRKLVIEPLSLDMIQEFSFDILCGEECVHTYISRNLAALHETM